MEAPPELIRASREDLIALIVAQHEEHAVLRRENARLAAEVATLTGRVGELLAALAAADGDETGSRPTTMPGLRPGAPCKAAAAPAPRKRRSPGAARKRMTPTARQVHAYDHCPRCQTLLRGGTHKRRREVIEVAPARVVVTEHVYVERRCPRCHGRWHWQPGPELDGVVVGQRRFGVGLLSLIATLREELRLPVRAVQWYLAAVHGLRLSVGSIVAALHLLAARGGGRGRPAGGHPRRPGAARR